MFQNTGFRKTAVGIKFPNKRIARAIIGVNEGLWIKAVCFRTGIKVGITAERTDGINRSILRHGNAMHVSLDVA